MDRSPAIFVSSTCYDLRQVRADLKDFIESIGLRPVISEYDSFPIDPSVSAVENCLQAVDEQADIFLLIVGGRYGSINEQGKSVTNMEYLRARAKGIPIYVFIEKSVLNAIPLWKANPDGDFSSVVDSPKLFDFVNSVRDIDGVWTNTFEVAQQIADGLRKQLAYLFMDALKLRKRLKTSGLPHELSQLQGIPLRLVIERSPYWEYRLFAHAFAQEVRSVKEHCWDVEYDIALGPGAYLQETGEVIDWVLAKLNEGTRIASTLSNIVNVALPDAFGAPGVSGDPVKIVYACQRLAKAYQSSLEWAIETKRVRVPDEFENLVRILGTFLNGISSDVAAFSERVLKEIEDGIAKGMTEGGTIVMDLTLTLTLTGNEEFHKELDRLRHEGSVIL